MEKKPLVIISIILICSALLISIIKSVEEDNFEITNYNDTGSSQVAETKTAKTLSDIDYETNSEYIKYDEFLGKLENGEITKVFYDSLCENVYFIEKEIEIKEIGNLTADEIFRTVNPNYDTFKKDLLEYGVDVYSIELLSSSLIDSNRSLYGSGTIGYILVLVLGCAFLYSMYSINKQANRVVNAGYEKQQSDGNKNNSSNVKKFSDIAGLKEVKEDVQTLVDFMVNGQKYKEMGAKLPKGVILYGPPGTGKTLIAKAIAGEAGVPFLYASGSDFVEMYVGVGAKRIRELFADAKKKAPCIIFIDEIDAVCGKRSANENSEDRKTINAILTEMDGFNSKDNILVIGATNRLEDLDPAILRPGRFTNKYCVPLPSTVEDRLAIIEIYVKNKKLLEDVDLNLLAKQTIGCSPADIENILNEAAILATRNKLMGINKECLEESYNKHILKGHVRKDNKSRLDEELTLVAWHEAGHALTGLLLGAEVDKVTILSSTSGAGGATFTVPKKMGLHSVEDLKNEVIQLYAGRCAEYLLYKDWNKTTTGASNDIERATNIIKEMCCRYGMDKDYGMINLMQLNVDNKELVEKVSKMSKELEDECLKMLESNKDTLEEIAKALLDKETIYASELDKISNKETSIVSEKTTEIETKDIVKNKTNNKINNKINKVIKPKK